LFYCIAMQPGTSISFGINEGLSYLYFIVFHKMLCYFILLYSIFLFIILLFISLLFYCIDMQPGTRISFGINKVLSYLYRIEYNRT